MTFAAIGASAAAALGASAATAGTVGSLASVVMPMALSGGMQAGMSASKKTPGPQLQPGAGPEEGGAAPYTPTTAKAPALPPPMPTQPIPAAGAPTAAPQMPQSMSPEELKKMYGIG